MPEGGIYAQYPCRDGGGGLRFVRQGSEECTKNIRHRGSPTPPKAASARGAVLAPRSLRATDTPCSPSDLPEGPRSSQPSCKDSSTTWTSDSRPASLAAHTTETSAEPAYLSTQRQSFSYPTSARPSSRHRTLGLPRASPSCPEEPCSGGRAGSPGRRKRARREPVSLTGGLDRHPRRIRGPEAFDGLQGHWYAQRVHTLTERQMVWR